MERIGRYRLIEQSGWQAGGTVWRGEAEDGRPVVITILDPSAVVVDVLESTRRLLDHPNIVGVREVLGAGHNVALVTDQVNAPSLADVILRAGGPLPYGLARTILDQVIDALSFAHANGTAHGRLTPASVRLLSGVRGLHVRVTGFEAAVTRVRPADEVGDPREIAFLAPERVTRAGAPEPASDIYGAGALLYAMMTGRAPFEEKNPRLLLRAIVRRPPRPASAPGLEVHPALAKVVLRALAKEPSLRHASMRELYDGVRDAEIAARPEFAPARPLPRIGAAPTPSFAHAAAAPARGWLRWAIPAAAVVALAVVLGLAQRRAGHTVPAVAAAAPLTVVAPRAAAPTAPPPAAEPARPQASSPSSAGPAVAQINPKRAPDSSPAASNRPEISATGSTAPEQPNVAPGILGRHEVRPGESLFCIARTYGVSPVELAHANHRSWRVDVPPGTVLDVPDVPWEDMPPGPRCTRQF